MIINVSGHAERDVAPDLGVTHLNVGFSGNNKALVLAKTHERANWLAEQIEALPGDEIVKYSSDGVRNYSYTRLAEKVKEVIYEASCSFEVTFQDLATLSQQTAKWTQAEGVEHSWTDWDLTDARKAAVLAELLGEALDAAKAKAVAIANHLTENEPRVMEVREDRYGGRQSHAAVLYGSAPDGSDGSPFEARPEDLHLTYSIDVIFSTDKRD